MSHDTESKRILAELEHLLESISVLAPLLRTAVRMAVMSGDSKSEVLFQMHLDGLPDLATLERDSSPNTELLSAFVFDRKVEADLLARSLLFSKTKADGRPGKLVEASTLAQSRTHNGNDTVVLGRSAEWIDSRLAHLAGIRATPGDRTSLGTMRASAAYEQELYASTVLAIRNRVAAFAASARRIVYPPPASMGPILDQKFGILRSVPQACRDVDSWAALGPVALIFFDLDEFKAINTQHGEPRVDEYILTPTHRLIAALATDRGAGYSVGGDEFVIVLRNVDVGEATAFAEKLRSSISDYKFSVGGIAVRVTTSLGIALSPTNGSSYDELVVAAAAAEKIAKKSGRNRYAVAIQPSGAPAEK